MPLDSKVTFAQMREKYSKDSTNDTFNAIIYGDSGTGKTTCVGRTARAPVLIFSYDKGGTKVLKKEIEEGRVLVERFEDEDPTDPKMFMDSMKRLDELKKGEIFKDIGTLVFDSITTLTQNILYYILKQEGRAEIKKGKGWGGVPQQQDYNPCMYSIEHLVREAISLPCDVILICHVDELQDQTTGSVMKGPLITGKLRHRLPLLVDEMYFSQAKTVGAETRYSLITQASNQFKAKTRMGGGIFERVEEPDIKEMLRKAGCPYEDKPLHI